MSQPKFDQHNPVSTVKMSEEGSSTSSPSDNKSKKVADKQLTELNREIGYVMKGVQLVPMTDFSVTCTGYVT